MKRAKLSVIELPKNVLVDIILPFTIDTLEDALKMMLVCRSWYEASKSPKFWLYFLKKKFDMAIGLLERFNVNSKLITVLKTMWRPVPDNLYLHGGMKAVVLSTLFPAERMGYKFKKFGPALDKFGRNVLEMSGGFYSGYGIDFWTGDRLLCGQMVDGQVNGPGVLYGINRRVEGFWENGLLSGDIITNYLDGSWARGLYVAGHYSGQCVYNNRSMRFIITCQFKRSRFHGFGTLKYDNGVILEGVFDNDHLMGQATITWPNGDRYTGNFKMGRRLGKGVFYDALNDRYIDQDWKEGDDEFCLDGAPIHTERGDLGVIPPRYPKN